VIVGTTLVTVAIAACVVATPFAAVVATVSAVLLTTLDTVSVTGAAALVTASTTGAGAAVVAVAVAVFLAIGCGAPTGSAVGGAETTGLFARSSVAVATGADVALAGATRGFATTTLGATCVLRAAGVARAAGALCTARVRTACAG
jgi:hypothetical protein